MKTPDWTCDARGHANSSSVFTNLTFAIDRVIQDGASDLISGRSRQVATMILAQLAHKYGMSTNMTAEQVQAILEGE